MQVRFSLLFLGMRPIPLSLSYVPGPSVSFPLLQRDFAGQWSSTIRTQRAGAMLLVMRKPCVHCFVHSKLACMRSTLIEIPECRMLLLKQPSKRKCLHACQL